MFPEAFAERWIAELTEPGDLILDPFCGRGTAPFQAVLMDRRAVGGDINPVAYCITRAKTNSPTPASLRTRITRLERDYASETGRKRARALPDFYRHAYQPKTLRQILYLRSRLRWRASDVDCMLAALMLGALHGESERSLAYLSNQMPRTISTKPDYSVRYWKKRRLRPPKRDVFALLRDRVDYRYASDPPKRRADIYCGDVRDLVHDGPIGPGTVKAVITSPPYLDVTNFEEDQWLRLWFLGGPPYPTRGRISTDDRHYSLDGYWGLIADTWRTLGQLVAPAGHVVMRLGFKKLSPHRIVDGALASSALAKRQVRLVGYDVSEIRGRQTGAFRPGSSGCLQEVDIHLEVS
jgi:hypothetical protein